MLSKESKRSINCNPPDHHVSQLTLTTVPPDTSVVTNNTPIIINNPTAVKEAINLSTPIPSLTLTKLIIPNCSLIDENDDGGSNNDVLLNDSFCSNATTVTDWDHIVDIVNDSTTCSTIKSSSVMTVDQKRKIKSWWDGVADIEKHSFETFKREFDKLFDVDEPVVLTGNGGWGLRLNVSDNTSPVLLAEILDKVIRYKQELQKNDIVEMTLQREIATLLIEYGVFELSLKKKGHKAELYSSKTPGTGYCYYLMHYQAMQYLLHREDGFPDVDKSCIFSAEFRSCVATDIEMLSNHIRSATTIAVDNINVRGTDNTEVVVPLQEVELCKIYLQKLRYIFSVISDEQNIQNQVFFLPLKQIPEGFFELSGPKKEGDMDFQTWGVPKTMGISFLKRTNLPFSFYVKGSNNNRALFSMYSLNTSLSCSRTTTDAMPFQVLKDMVNTCGNHKYAGYFDGSVHFHLIEKPILSHDMLLRGVQHISTKLFALLINVELGNSPEYFLNKLELSKTVDFEQMTIDEEGSIKNEHEDSRNDFRESLIPNQNITEKKGIQESNNKNTLSTIASLETLRDLWHHSSEIKEAFQEQSQRADQIQLREFYLLVKKLVEE